jgi:hypothetical protein
VARPKADFDAHPEDHTLSRVSICGRTRVGAISNASSQQKPALCQRTSVSGRMMVKNLRIAGNSVLGFKPQLRLEWRGQDGQCETG